MKHIIIAFLILLCSCKKNSSSNQSVAQASFAFIDSRVPAGSDISITSGSNAELDCLYYSGSPGAGYKFIFAETYPAQAGIHFTVASLSPGQTISYFYSSAATPNYSGDCVLFDGTQDIVSGSDSAKLILSISRYSNGTMDGSFSLNIWDKGSINAIITSGKFSNIAFVSR